MLAELWEVRDAGRTMPHGMNLCVQAYRLRLGVATRQAGYGWSTAAQGRYNAATGGGAAHLHAPQNTGLALFYEEESLAKGGQNRPPWIDDKH